MAHIAARTGSPAVVRALLAAGSDVRATTASRSPHAAHRSSENQYGRIMAHALGSIRRRLGLAGPSETFSDADWDTSIGVMQTGVFLCSQVVGRHMLERGRGTIVNTSSMNAWEAFPMRLAYCAAKAAVVAMTQVLAIEWADRGIRVNAVAPGVTRTALVQKGIDDGVIDVAAYRARTPMHRFAEPDEIARVVLFLACDEDSSFVTGTTLCADGGWSAMGWIYKEEGDTASPAR